MNVVDRFFLWLFLLPGKWYEKAGINLEQLRAVLVAKLTMDNRRPASFFSAGKRKQQQEQISGSTLKTMAGSLLMGVIMLFSFSAGTDRLTGLTLYMTMFIFMLCLTLITDFTSVLIDVRDNLIILPKPINDRTFLMARLLHITVRICMVVTPMALPGCLTLAVLSGPVTILPFLLMALLMTLFSIFLINAVYVLIMKLTTPEKFKTVINGIQIVFVVLFMAAYQLMPQLISNHLMEDWTISDVPFIRLYPAIWFSETCLFLSGQIQDSAALISLVLSIVVPLISVWLVVKYFAPSFNQKLAIMAGGTTERSVRTSVKTQGKRSWMEWIGSRLTKPGAEYAGFLFAWHMMQRSRDFRMKVLPQIGYLIVFAVIFFLRNHNLEISFLLLIYMSSLMLSGSLLQMPYSEKHKASWLFLIAPVERPGQLISGAVKAALILFYLPVILVLLVVGTVLMGPQSLLSILLGCVNVLSIETIIAYLLVHRLPFSNAQEGTAGGSSFIQTMLLMIFPAMLGLLHWFIKDYTFVVVLLLFISAVVPWLVLDEVKRLGWEKIKS